MKNSTLLLTILALTFTTTFSSHADEPNCESPQVTIEIKQCLSMDLEDADYELNRVYKSRRADQDEEANELLKLAQRAWITYRDSECARVADTARGGTLSGVLELSCHVDMTVQRYKELSINVMTGETEY